MSHIDNCMQYGEDEEPKEPKDMDMGDFAEAEEWLRVFLAKKCIFNQIMYRTFRLCIQFQIVTLISTDSPFDFGAKHDKKDD